MTGASEYADWTGRREEARDIVGHGAAQALAAVLDRQAPSDGAPPPLVHWLAFPPRTPQSGLGPDGHPRRGSFLPPVRLPRRMWAGGDLRFTRPLRTGVPVQRTSVIADVREREGRSGPLVLVAVDHELRQEGTTVLTERQDIVYRAAPRGSEPENARPPEPAEEPPRPVGWRETVVPDPVLLFRYSALTFNAHRIHYDRGYAREEGYPGLVVQGPLTATLLLDLYVRRSEARVRAFRFRAVRPAYDGRALVLHAAPTAGGADLLAVDDQGRTVMRAEVET